MTRSVQKTHPNDKAVKALITDSFARFSNAVSNHMTRSFAEYTASLVLHKGKSSLATSLISSPGIDPESKALSFRNGETAKESELLIGSDKMPLESHQFILSCPGQVRMEIRAFLPRGESTDPAHDMLRSISGDFVSIAEILLNKESRRPSDSPGKGSRAALQRGDGSPHSTIAELERASVPITISIDGRKLDGVVSSEIGGQSRESESSGLVGGKNEGKPGSSLLQMSRRSKPQSSGDSPPAFTRAARPGREEMIPAQLLLRQTALMGKSADMSTLLYSLVSSVREVLGSDTRCACWTIRSDLKEADLDFEDPPVGVRSTHSAKRIDEDSLFSSAISSEGLVFVEGEPVPGYGEGRGKGAEDTRLLVTLGHGDVPSHFLVFSLDNGTSLDDKQLFTLELLARNAHGRAETLFGARSLEIEKRIASLLSDHLSGGYSSKDAAEMIREICKSIMSRFPELEGLACFKREGGTCKPIANFHRDEGDVNSVRDLDSTHISKFLQHDSEVAMLFMDSPGWTGLSDTYGELPRNAHACTIVTSSVSSGDYLLLLFHSDHSPTEQFGWTLRTLFSGLAAIEETFVDSSKQGKLMSTTDKLLDRLESFSFADGPREVAGGFAETLISIAGADVMHFYHYDESNALFTPLFDVPTNSPANERKLTLHDFNLLSSTPGKEGDFVVRISRARKQLWDSLIPDQKIRVAYAAVIMDGKKPVSLLVLGFIDEKELNSIEEHMLMRVCRTLSNLLSSSRTLHDTVERSHFSSEFLRILSQSMMFREGGWSFEVEQIANRMCSLIGTTMQKEFVYIFSSKPDRAGLELVGKWSRHTHDEMAVDSEARSVMALETGLEDSDEHGRVRTHSVDAKRFVSLHGKGVTSATVLQTGNEDGPLPVTLLLLDTSPRRLSKTETQTVSTALEETRLMLESRLRRSIIDWTLNAMRSELRIARNLSSTFDMSAVLDGTVREVANFLGTEICLVELINERGGSGMASITDPSGRRLMDMHAGENSPHTQLDERKKGFSTLVLETGGNLSLRGEEACMDAVALLPSRDRSIVEFAADGKNVKALFGVPLSFAGKLLGLLVCMRTSEEVPFGKNETSYLESVAALTSTAIENSRNVESTIGALSKLRKLDTLRSNFSSIAAHELRTPLTSIRVYIELMKMGKVGNFTDQEKKNIDHLLASISELTDIINNMLEFTRMEAMLLETEMFSVSLKPVVEETCALLSPTANAKSIKLELEVEKEIKNVSANAALIKRVINNLIGNALKFTPEGGRITVNLKNDREGILIMVEDTGKGIPSEDLPYIFDRFHVVDSSILHSRTGFRLGLPISKLIVERHGGRIWADSEVGKGSKFYVLLPVSQGVSTEVWLSEATGYIH